MILHSKTRPRHKQRVAAGSASAADLGSEVPNLGIARALFVILLLHVVAIGAIFVHNKVTDNDPIVNKSPVQDGTAVAAAALNEEELPRVQKGEDYYFVTTGDTYEKIATRKAVDVTALKELNNNVALKAGRILRLPTGAAVPAAARVPARNVPLPVAAAPDPVLEAPDVVPPRTAPVVAEIPRATIIEEQPPAPIEEPPAVAVVVTPKINPAVAEVVPEPVVAPVGLVDSGKRYKVVSGDSVWGITRKFKVKQEDLLKINGIADANKLRAGMELKIPGSN